MRRLTHLLLRQSELKKSASIARQRDMSQTVYGKAYSRVLDSVVQATQYEASNFDLSHDQPVGDIFELEDILLPKTKGAPRTPTRLEHYFFSRLTISGGKVKELTPVEVAISGTIMEKSWRTSLPEEDPCFNNHAEADETNCFDCEQHEKYRRETIKVIDSIIARNSNKVTLYDPHMPSEITHYIKRYLPGEWSTSDILPIGLIIERSALELLVAHHHDDILKGVRGRIIITNW